MSSDGFDGFYAYFFVIENSIQIQLKWTITCSISHKFKRQTKVDDRTRFVA